MSKRLKLDIQKFALTYISTHSTYYQNSNSNSFNGVVDARPYYNFYYSQNIDGSTTYQMDVYSQSYTGGLGGEGELGWVNFDITCVIAGEVFKRTGRYYDGGYHTVQLFPLFSVTKTVPCNADGSGVPITYSIQGQAVTLFPYRYGSTYPFTPPTVQLNATLDDISNFTIGENFEISSNIYNEDYINTLTIKIGDVIIGTRTISEAKTTISFSNSELSTIYSASTETLTPTFTFELTSEDLSGTQIGVVSKKEAQGTITNAKPIVTWTHSVSTTDKSGTNIIKGFSDVTINVTATPQKSATIKSIKVDGQECLVSGTNTGRITIESATKGVFPIVVTDSRGEVNTALSTNIHVEPYEPVTIDASFTRQSSTSGIIDMSINGTYWNSEFGNVNNSLVVTIQYRVKTPENNGTWLPPTAVTLTPTINDTTHTYTINKTVNSAMGIDDFSYQKDYEFLVIATDKLNIVSRQETVVRGIGILELYSDTALVNGNLEVTKDTNLIGKLKKNGNDFVVDNLTTTDIDRALSANQGKILKALIDAAGETESQGTNYITYKNGLKMCWGSGTTQNLNGYFRQATLGFPITFDSAPIVIPAWKMTDGAVADARTTCAIFGDPGIDGVTIRIGNPNAELTNRAIFVWYFAIGF